MPVKVQRRGLKGIPRYESMSVKAGVLAGAIYPDEPIVMPDGSTRNDPRAGMAVAVIAAALEYGTRQNHPRPFMQTTVSRETATWKKALRTLMSTGKGPHEALLTVGAVMEEDIRQTITDWPADNSDDWAAIKGFNKGLIWTSHLLHSIKSALEHESKPA